MEDELEGLEENEGVRNLRARLEQESEARKAAEATAAAVQAEREAELFAARETNLKQEFKGLGLNENMATLYPVDGAVSADAVAEWASNFGISSQAVREPENETELDRYNKLIAGAWDTGNNQDDLGSKLERAVRETLRKRTRPSDAELADAEQLTQAVNEVHKQAEREVLAGRVSFGNGGIAEYGGRVQPPRWANRTLEATQ